MMTIPPSRLGFHYYPDTLHYRQEDLQTWLPELCNLGATWLVLQAPLLRAIPEYFIDGLLRAGIRPVLHFHLPADGVVDRGDLSKLFRNYARWGVRYVALFDCPNNRSAWSATSWAQISLVERFLDGYLPLAELALLRDLYPVFPPLQPGGDYWDLAFLREALRGIQRRGHSRLLERLVLGVYAWVGNRSLDWGAGGPDRWPGARPYFTPDGVQDQRGFRIFDWYQAIAQQELGEPLPMLALKGGGLPGDDVSEPAGDDALTLHAHKNLAVAQLMATVDHIPSDEAQAGDMQSQQLAQQSKTSEVMPSQVLACNFWLLAAEPGSPFLYQAWFQPGGQTLPAVDALRRWVSSLRKQSPGGQLMERFAAESADKGVDEIPSNGRHPIAHYILMPQYAWGAVDWELELIHSVYKDSHPTIGFSFTEACLARRVTVFGGEGAIPEQALQMLRSAGCQVERLNEDGTIDRSVSDASDNPMDDSLDRAANDGTLIATYDPPG